MAKYRNEVDEIMRAYNDGAITIDEANRQLDALDGVVDGKYGVGFFLDANKGKDCNAWMDCGIGGAEPIKVVDGKVVKPTGMHPSYYIYYNGETYHVAEDCVTLIPGAPERTGVDREPLPTLQEAMHRDKDNAGKTVRIATQGGLYDVTVNENGYATSATRV